MCGERLFRFLEDARQCFLADKHHDRQLCVPPAGVAEELVDGLAEALGAGPELTLADEQVAPFVADQDVRLALLVERLGVRGRRSACSTFRARVPLLVTR
jgi:hypothetical protein